VFLSNESDASTGNAPLLHIVVASQEKIENVSLPVLSTARTEPELIRSSVGDGAITIAHGDGASREGVLSALADPGAWVHIAAHGSAEPHRLGYAGLWLESTDSEATPPFLSWLDVQDQGVRASLVVLNACRLGDNGGNADASLSFAEAMARAGAGQVVAPMWPVSDAAAALWVPEFYRSLTSNPAHRAADAMRAAQLRLRDSRAFTHPFFWAGLQTFGHIAVSAVHGATANAARIDPGAASR
jgi:CHAT domain-containing protein